MLSTLRKKILFNLGFFFILLIIGHVLDEGSSFGLKREFDNLGESITLFALTPIPLLLILLFCREAAYRSWKKFSLWYFGIFAVLLSPIIITSLHDGAGSGYNGGLMANPASVDVGGDVLILGLYFVLSLIVIIRAQIQAKI